MEMHRLGIPCDATLRNFSLQTDWNVHPPQYGLSAVNIPQITQCRVEPRIINGNLMIQTKQHMFINQMMYDSLETCGRHYTIGETVGRTLLVCQDQGKSSYIERRVDKAVAKLVERHLQESSGLAFDGTVKCRCCLSEFTLAIYNHPNQGFEIVLTTWVNLGSCERDDTIGWYLATSKALDSIVLNATALDEYRNHLGYPSDHEAGLSAFSHGAQVDKRKRSISSSYREELIDLAYTPFICSALVYCSIIGVFRIFIRILRYSVGLCRGGPRNKKLPRIPRLNPHTLLNPADDDLILFLHDSTIPEHIIESAFARPLRTNTKNHPSREVTESPVTQQHNGHITAVDYRDALPAYEP